MDDLLPCPFCGGEAKRSSETFERTICSWVYCTNCGAAGGYRHTEAEAIAAWNTRFHSEFEKTVIKAWKEIQDYTERTCRNDSLKHNAGVFVCSECGVYLDIDDMNWDGEDDSGGFYEPHYCPNCGARVIGGDE